MNCVSCKWSRIRKIQRRGGKGTARRREKQGGEKRKNRKNDKKNKGRRGTTGIRRNVSNNRRREGQMILEGEGRK
jgi:hypothetical protein